MPSDFECITCKLGFSVGTYHYHANTEGFCGSTLFVCCECGLQHRLEIPDGAKLADVFYLESMPELLIEPPRIGETMLVIPDGEWRGRLAVESRSGNELPCLGCSADGTLIDSVEPGCKCPNCGEMLPKSLADWMT